jgi:hypothetical protein
LLVQLPDGRQHGTEGPVPVVLPITAVRVSW